MNGEGFAAFTGLRVDTWYMCASDEIGRIVVGDHSLVKDAIVLGDLMLEYVDQFQSAFSKIARVTYLDLSYKETVDSNMRKGIQATYDQMPQTFHKFASERAAPFSVIGVTALFDVRITVRGFNDELYDKWFIGQGMLNLFARWDEIPARLHGDLTQVPWDAILNCTAASAFRRSNRSTLDEQRSKWHNMSGQDQAKSKRDGTQTDEIYIFALAIPPRNSPIDNSELYKYNTPLLQAAVADWERSAGRSFIWQLPLDQAE